MSSRAAAPAAASAAAPGNGAGKCQRHPDCIRFKGHSGPCFRNDFLPGMATMIEALPPRGNVQQELGIRSGHGGSLPGQLDLL